MTNALITLRGTLEIYRGPEGRLLWTSDTGEGMPGNLFSTDLSVIHYRDNKPIAAYDLGSGVVTTAGVNLMAADWTNATATIRLINYHDSGTGTASAFVTDTALSAPIGLPRVTGTQSNTNNVYSTSGVITYQSTASVTEWGLFTAATSGVLFDRRAFSLAPIDVETNDQLRWQYFLTLASGG